MQATAVAKALTKFYTEALGDMYDAGITYIGINHLRTKIKLGVTPNVADINYLSPDDAVPGGKAQLYLTNTLIKTVGKTKFDPSEGFGIQGFLIEAKLIKSRSNCAGVTCNLVFDQHNGIDNILSNYMLLKELEMIGGAGRGFFLKNYDKMKFTQKEFKNKLYSDKTMQSKFRELCEQALELYVPETNTEKGGIPSENNLISVFFIPFQVKNCWNFKIVRIS